MADAGVPRRQLRALYDDDTITVYQAYVSRDGFEWALRHASLSHEPARKDRRPARVQWDPERSLQLERLDHRAIQVGLGGEAVARYVDEWITGLSDVTPLAHEIHALVEAGELDAARARLPVERP
ncbi:MAG TPA: DUF4291 family protein, partial [Solirubrobacteraceae bacterium]